MKNDSIKKYLISKLQEGRKRLTCSLFFLLGGFRNAGPPLFSIFHSAVIHVLYTDPQRKVEKFFEDIFIVTLLQFFSDSSPKRRK